jgi:hypothetical protein
MKNSLFYILLIAASVNSMAQNGNIKESQNDFIGRNEFYILRTGSDTKSVNKLKVSELKSSNAAEQLFGTKYTTKKQAEFMSMEGFTEINYDDGLTLNIPEHQKSSTGFRITSDKYTIFLENGTAIRIGMKAVELEAIFPKSFSKRKVITDRADWKGKATLDVYFSEIVNNKKVLEASRLVFVLSNKDGVLEQILSYVPN